MPESLTSSARMSTPPSDPREQPVEFDVRHEPADVLNGLANLIEQYSAQRVMSMVRYLATINGEEV